MPTALLLSMQNLAEWSASATQRWTPGGRLPYGLDLLRDHYVLTWSDAQRSGVWGARPAQAIGGVARRTAPGLQGLVGALYGAGRARPADVVVSVFENAGLGFARLQESTATITGRTPHVMLTCWMAEDCQHMRGPQLRSVRRSLRSVARLTVFSSNQAPLLAEFLGVGPERIEVVPFGVDTRYYDPALVTGGSGGGGIVAVGGDSRRDYATLVAAARIAKMPITLVCYPRNIVGLELPPNVQIRAGVYTEEYRRLLLSADLIVTPTVAPAYPSGQSVVLEAMSMGRATLTTDSAAMRDYVTDGLNGRLVPPREPGALAELMGSLLADDRQRASLGAAAARTVRESFGLEQMWERVAKVMSSAARPGLAT